MARKELIGKVVSNKMLKTVVVAVENYVPHARYEKQIIRTKRFKAHDPHNRCQIGDVVRIEECPPISRDKRFRVVAVVGSERDISVPTEELEA
jgi:small subunit ribosomal protein S17